MSSDTLNCTLKYTSSVNYRLPNKYFAFKSLETYVTFTTLDVTSTSAIPGADPGFPVEVGANSPGGANIQICQIFPKTA